LASPHLAIDDSQHVQVALAHGCHGHHEQFGRVRQRTDAGRVFA